jgi:hypothetical protein
MDDPSKPKPIWNTPLANLAKVLLLLIVLLLVVVFTSNAIVADDWTWYSHDFTALPARILVYHNGQMNELMRGRPGFDALAEAVRASLASGVQQQSNTGLSDQSLLEARQRFVTVEAYFDQPVQVHAGFFTGRPTQMLFPITGRHSDWPIVFLGTDGGYEPNAPVLLTKDPLLHALRTLGYIP